jgi:hypothetical protein
MNTQVDYRVFREAAGPTDGGPTDGGPTDGGPTDGVLTPYTFDGVKTSEEAIKEYIQDIPRYVGDRVPNVLERSRTVLRHHSNYFHIESFLFNLHKFFTSNDWGLGGLFSAMRSDRIMAFLIGPVTGAVRFSKENTIKKQILFKKVGEKTVAFIINVTGSDKMHNDASHVHTPINDIFKNKIFIVNYTTATRGQKVVVKCYNIDSSPDETIKDESRLTWPTGITHSDNLTVTGIKEILGRSNSVFAIDPNILADGTTIEWFGNSGTNIDEIDKIVKRIVDKETSDLALPITYGSAAVSSGGNKVKKIKSNFQKRRRSRRYRLNTTRKLKKRARKTSCRRRVHSYKK